MTFGHERFIFSLAQKPFRQQKSVDNYFNLYILAGTYIWRFGKNNAPRFTNLFCLIAAGTRIFSWLHGGTQLV